MSAPRRHRPPDPRATGQVLSHARQDGPTSWYLRVRAYGRRYRVTLGTELDGWTPARAAIELQNVLAKIQAGIWDPPTARPAAQEDPTFHEFASQWLDRRRPSFKPRTHENYSYLLTNHLLPTLAPLRLSQIDYATVDAYVESKQLDAEDVRETRRRGLVLRDENGRVRRPSPTRPLTPHSSYWPRSSTTQCGESSSRSTRPVRRVCD